MKVDDVVDMIRGQADTVVRLSVNSEDKSGLHTVRLVCEKIELEDRASGSYLSRRTQGRRFAKPDWSTRITHVLRQHER